MLFEPPPDFDPSEPCDLVRSNDVDTAELASLDEGRHRNQNGLRDTFLEMKSAEHPSPQSLDFGQIDLNREGMRLRISRGKNLADYTDQLLAAYGINDDPNLIASRNQPEISFRDRGFQAKT